VLADVNFWHNAEKTKAGSVGPVYRILLPIEIEDQSSPWLRGAASMGLDGQS
jgi:hypothetical protein